MQKTFQYDSFHPREKLVSNIGKNIKGKSNYFALFQGATGKLISAGNI